MHPAHIAQRNAQATNKTRIAADRIAVSLGIEPLNVRITPRGGPEVAQLQLREAIAGFLETIADATEPRRESRPRAGKGAAVTATEGETDERSETIRERVSQLAGND